MNTFICDLLTWFASRRGYGFANLCSFCIASLLCIILQHNLKKLIFLKIDMTGFFDRLNQQHGNTMQKKGNNSIL